MHEEREIKRTMAKLLTQRAVKGRQEIRSRKRVAIAAIDFGTTFCSLAYTLSDDDKVNLIELNHHQQRVPTAILLRKQGLAADGTPQLVTQKFGFDAQYGTITLTEEERPHHVYFELVKMLLYTDNQDNRSDSTINLPVKSLSGEQYYLVEVIAYVLKHLKQCLMEWLQRAAPLLKTADIHWVITVPAIWKQDGKQMMREAAYRAGLFNDITEGITHFTQYGTRLHRSMDEHTERLSLALEPECIALHCQQLPNDQIAAFSDPIKNPDNMKNCLVLDIGGGTVDITALKQDGDQAHCYEVTVPPTGNEFGGMQVNERFKEFLQALVGDNNGFESFLKKRKTHDEHNAILKKIVNQDFERMKVSFGSHASYPDDRTTCATSTTDKMEWPRMELPKEFLDCYSKRIGQKLKNESNVELSGKLFMISHSKMASFFDSVLEKMSDLVINAVRDANENGHLSIVYMAGGFGGCKYVYQYLKHKIKLSLPNLNVPFIVPTDHTLAVCRGAVLYGRNPGAITMREMEASYGIRVSNLFQEGVHEERHAYVDQDGTKRCGDIFRPFVIQGDRVKANDVFTIKVAPQFHTDTEARIGFYCSTNPDVRYTNDAGTSQIGNIKLSIPNPTDQPVTERTIEIMMNFSSTEIKATARASYHNDKPPVSTVLDFLN